MARRKRKRKTRRGRKFKIKLPKNAGAFIFAAAMLLAGFLWTKNAMKIQQPAAMHPRRPVPAAVRPKPARSAWTFQMPEFARPLGKGPKLVFVIDDMGHTIDHLDLLDRLGGQVTYAILPFLKHSSFFDQYSLQTQAEVILHLPMESIKGTIPGPGLILGSMSDESVQELIRRELDSLPHASGVNNHMGSKGTSDRHMMNLILREFRGRGLFFLDSMTTPDSVTRDTARGLNYPSVLKRDVFFDNVDEPEKIREQVRLLASIAKLRGYAVGIGHYRQNTLQVLNEEIPRLKKEGFEIVHLRDLLRLKRA